MLHLLSCVRGFKLRTMVLCCIKNLGFGRTTLEVGERPQGSRMNLFNVNIDMLVMVRRNIPEVKQKQLEVSKLTSDHVLQERFTIMFRQLVKLGKDIWVTNIQSKGPPSSNHIVRTWSEMFVR